MSAPPSDPSTRDSSPSVVSIRSPRVRTYLPPPTAAKAVLKYHWENREHLAPWSPPSPPGYYSEEFWKHRLAANRAEYVEDRSLRLMMSFADGDDIIGSVAFTEIRRGPSQACHLGYGIAQAHEGKGLMAEALEAAIAFVFSRLAIHRIEAAYVPDNERSARTLQRLGFVVEGQARDYLFIAGQWRDHVLTSLTNPNATEPGLAR
jgi:ribosomal-protein-alanine N-acetyltransferase